MPLAVIAIGGNALARAGTVGTIEEQFANARLVCSKFAFLSDHGWDLVLTHGNGPQVGKILWRVELAAAQVDKIDLGICDASSQGQIGYMLQQVLNNELRTKYVDRTAVTLVTQVVVDKSDPAFENPTKPIGPFFSKEDAEARAKQFGWEVREDSNRGWRRVVPSPQPLQVVEADVILRCVRAGIIPIAVGGGGVPVVRRDDGGLEGIEAVIDKDLSTAVLAKRVAADVMVICTAVPQVMINFGKPNEKALGHVSAKEMRAYHAEGHFPPGSMGPKIKACIDFVEGGGVGTTRRALITDIDNLKDALSGRAGTVIST